MIELTENPIDTGHVLSLVHDPECGAEVLFVGTTRQWTAKSLEHPSELPERIETSHLIYEAYRQMAEMQMRKLETEARQRWPIRRVALVHRLGHVAASEASVAIAVSSPHRAEAFEAAHWLIDQLKHQVPIWKQEHYVQHGAQWIHPTAGNCQCTPAVNHSPDQTQTAPQTPTAQPSLDRLAGQQPPRQSITDCIQLPQSETSPR